MHAELLQIQVQSPATYVGARTSSSISIQNPDRTGRGGQEERGDTEDRKEREEEKGTARQRAGEREKDPAKRHSQRPPEKLCKVRPGDMSL